MDTRFQQIEQTICSVIPTVKKPLVWVSDRFHTKAHVTDCNETDSRLNITAIARKLTSDGVWFELVNQNKELWVYVEKPRKKSNGVFAFVFSVALAVAMRVLFVLYYK
jgi:hypothetical protein